MRKYKFVLLAVLILPLFLFSTGCFFLDFIFGPSPDDNGEDKDTEPEEISEEEEEFIDDDLRETTFYLTDGHQNLVPVVRPIEWSEGIATKTLNKMSQCQENIAFWEDTDLQPTLPEGSEVLGMTIRDGLARVNFSEDLLDVDAPSEEMVLNSIVYTLTEFDTVDEVEFMIEGEYLDGLPAAGELMMPVQRKGINTPGVLEGPQDGTAVTVYQVSEQGEYLVPVTEYHSEDDELIGRAIYHLVEGPEPESGLTSYVSSELSLNDVTMANSTIQLDVANLADDPEQEELALKQLVYTLTEFPDIEHVEVALNGEVLDAQEVMNIDMINLIH